MTLHITSTRRTVTADRVLPNTFYLYYPGNGVYETTNGGARGHKYIADRSQPYSGYNAELQSVPGEAGNLFFTGGPQSGTQPITKAFIDQPIGEQHGQLFPMSLK